MFQFWESLLWKYTGEGFKRCTFSQNFQGREFADLASLSGLIGWMLGHMKWFRFWLFMTWVLCGVWFGIGWTLPCTLTHLPPFPILPPSPFLLPSHLPSLPTCHLDRHLALVCALPFAPLPATPTYHYPHPPQPPTPYNTTGFFSLLAFLKKRGGQEGVEEKDWWWMVFILEGRRYMGLLAFDGKLFGTDMKLLFRGRGTPPTLLV